MMCSRKARAPFWAEVDCLTVVPVAGGLYARADKSLAPGQENPGAAGKRKIQPGPKPLARDDGGTGRFAVALWTKIHPLIGHAPR